MIRKNLPAAAGTTILALAVATTAGCANRYSPAIAGATQVEAPPPAEAIANALEYTRFQPCGQDLALEVFESGTAVAGNGFLDGIDTFPDKKARDAWLAQAVHDGVAPFLEADTWVVYDVTGSLSDPCTSPAK
jgi:hypothetical protein